jgi:hypothetical protein
MKIVKIISIVIFAVICAFALFYGFRSYQIETKFASPLPEKDGMKIIIVTPTPEKGEE